MSARPFLKWVGGKRGLLDQLRPMLPASCLHYFEPFIGGGAMFFGLPDLRLATIGDANAELIRCYEAVRDAPESVIRELEVMPITETAFYDLRALDPLALHPVSAAARMIYLNKTCFNGLYRVNKSGGFNSPWGKWSPDKLPTVCDGDNIRACSAALRNVQIVCGDFSWVCDSAGAGSFVYFDPPYVPVSKTANFTSYTSNGFRIADLSRLAHACEDLTSKGARFMLSNADVPTVRDAFAGFRIDTIQARRAVNCDATKRGKVSELVVRNYDDAGRIAA